LWSRRSRVRVPSLTFTVACLGATRARECHPLRAARITLRHVSYDLYMLTPEPGVEPMDQLERMEGEGPHAPDPEGEARARRLADALQAADARYEHEHEFEFEGTRGIELSAEDGLQITLMPDHASFNVPYWESLDPARITDDIERAAKLIAGETDWKLYDPQLEKFIDPASDAEEIRSAFDYGVDKVTQIVERQEAETRPFWKRLFGRG
jgi:hypothetical protein